MPSCTMLGSGITAEPSAPIGCPWSPRENWGCVCVGGSGCAAATSVVLGCRREFVSPETPGPRAAGWEETGSARGFSRNGPAAGLGPPHPFAGWSCGVLWGPWGGFTAVGWFEVVRWFRATGKGVFVGSGVLRVRHCGEGTQGSPVAPPALLTEGRSGSRRSAQGGTLSHGCTTASTTQVPSCTASPAGDVMCGAV